MSDISKNLKKYRIKNKLTQDQLAARLNVTRQAVSNWENNKSYPDLDMVVRLAEALDTDVNNLLYPEERERKRASWRSVSMKPVIWTFVVFFIAMTWGGGISVGVFQKICGGGVAETYLYPIYGGIILLAVLIAVCTLLIIEEIRNIGHIPEE